MKVLVWGASSNPERYSYKAIELLRHYGHEVQGVGLKEMKVLDVDVHTEPDPGFHPHTVTLYVGPQHQDNIMNQVIDLKPQRVIFNPGTENPIFYRKLNAAGISSEVACTLVLLRTGAF